MIATTIEGHNKLIPTYANCSVCGRTCLGKKEVPRTMEREPKLYTCGRVVAMWVPCEIPNHYRPVCNVCARPEELQPVMATEAA